jgi:hypothetical protein
MDNIVMTDKLKKAKGEKGRELRADGGADLRFWAERVASWGWNPGRIDLRQRQEAA